MKSYIFSAVSLSAHALMINNGALDFNAHYNRTTQSIIFTSTQPDHTWYGLLLGSSEMTNSDAVAFIANGTSSRAGDYYSTSRSLPTKDA